MLPRRHVGGGGHSESLQVERGVLQADSVGRDDAHAALCEVFHHLGRVWARLPSVNLPPVLEPYLAASISAYSNRYGDASRCRERVTTSSTHLNPRLAHIDAPPDEFTTRRLIRCRVQFVGGIEDDFVFGPGRGLRQHWKPIESAVPGQRTVSSFSWPWAASWPWPWSVSPGRTPAWDAAV